EACQGDGVIKIEMHFLPDVYVQCDVCKGKRYNRETLEISLKNKSSADVLDMTVEEGAEFFKAVPSIRDKLLTLQQVGLAYIHIVQPATTLSGGEAHGGKLSKELSRAPPHHSDPPPPPYPLRGRGAAGEALEGAVAALHRQDPLYPGRAHHRPAFRRREEAAGGAARAGEPGQHCGGDRAQP